MERRRIQETIKSIYYPHQLDEWDLEGWGEVLLCVAENGPIEQIGVSAGTGIPGDRVADIVELMDTLDLVNRSGSASDSAVEATDTTWSILLQSDFDSDVERLVGTEMGLEPDEQAAFAAVLSYIANLDSAVGIARVADDLGYSPDRVREIIQSLEEMAWVEPESDGVIVTKQYEGALSDLKDSRPSPADSESSDHYSSQEIDRLLEAETDLKDENQDEHRDVLRMIANHGPFGLVRLSNALDCSHERLREMLRSLEQQGWIKQSPDGPTVTEHFRTVISDLDGDPRDSTRSAASAVTSESEANETDLTNEHVDKGSIESVKGQSGIQMKGTEYGTVESIEIGDIEYFDLEIEEQIGQGGLGEVSLATTANGNQVAVKTPKSNGTIQVDVIEQLMSEAETWDKLDDHKHIVDIYGFDSSPVPWIVMEYMDGGSLQNRTEEFSVEEGLKIAISLTDAIFHAHRRGVVHLDLKPENVLFRKGSGGFNVPKIADWGLSERVLEESDSRSGLSPPYAAPEQFDESVGDLGQQTDIYQLGALLYRLLTGEQPYPVPTAAVPRAVLEEDPPVPSEKCDVPREVDDIVTTAMAKDPVERFEDVLYLRDRLSSILD